MWCVREEEIAEAMYVDYFEPLFNNYGKKSESGERFRIDSKKGDKVVLEVASGNQNAPDLNVELRLFISSKCDCGPESGKESSKKATVSEPVLWKRGRPDMNAIFSEVDESFTEPCRAGVAVCGPSPMIADIRQQCIDHSKWKGVQYDLHEELFYF